MHRVKLVIRKAHGLDLATLRARIDARVEHYGRKHPSMNIGHHYRWVNERHASAAYRGGNAVMYLLEGELVVELELPFIARIYKGKIEDFLRREADVITAPQSADAESGAP